MIIHPDGMFCSSRSPSRSQAAALRWRSDSFASQRRRDGGAKLLAGGNAEALVGYHRTYGLSVAQAFPCADRESQVNVATGFLPGPEVSLLDVGAYILAARTLVGELPIVDDSCAVCGQMRDPAAASQIAEKTP